MSSSNGHSSTHVGDPPSHPGNRKRLPESTPALLEPIAIADSDNETEDDASRPVPASSSTSNIPELMEILKLMQRNGAVQSETEMLRHRVLEGRFALLAGQQREFFDQSVTYWRRRDTALQYLIDRQWKQDLALESLQEMMYDILQRIPPLQSHPHSHSRSHSYSRPQSQSQYGHISGPSHPPPPHPPHPPNHFESGPGPHPFPPPHPNPRSLQKRLHQHHSSHSSTQQHPQYQQHQSRHYPVQQQH